jgi:hypothetical protein
MAFKKGTPAYEKMRAAKKVMMTERWADPEWRAKHARRHTGRKNTEETIAKMSAGQTAAWAKKPVGVCDICGETKPLNQDHNHVTGQLRGKLCMSCNTAIGHLRDNPVIIRSAADYLERWA